MSTSTADLRAAVRAALDQPDRAGQVPPAEQAIPVASGRWAEAAAVTAELARSDPSERVRVHAVQLWPRLLIFAGGGDMVERVAPFRAALSDLTADRSSAVRAAAVTALFEFATPEELHGLRAEWGRLVTDVLAHRGQWRVEAVLGRIRGSDHAREVLMTVLADPRHPPDDLAELLVEVEAEADPALAGLTGDLFAALVADRHPPTQVGALAGLAIWDDHTALAMLAFRAHIHCLGSREAAQAARLLPRAHRALLDEILTELVAHGAAGLAVLTAVVANRDGEPQVRIRAARAVVELCVLHPELIGAARAGLEPARDDAAVGTVVNHCLERIPVPVN